MAEVKSKVVGGVSVAAIVLAASAFIAPWEGLRLNPYRDIVGVLTVCYGETRGVENRKYTVAECEQKLHTGVGEFYGEMQKCIHKPLTEGQWVAVTSWAYNVGSSQACRSTLVRQINAGASAETWCKQLKRWNRAGGREVRGLTNRRKAEYAACVK